MASQKANRRHPPLVGYYNQREFVPASHNPSTPAPTIYVSAYHRTAPSQQRVFRHEQPAVWYPNHRDTNRNNVVHEYAGAALADPVVTPAPLMTAAIEGFVPVNDTPIPVVYPPTAEPKYRPMLHLPAWSLLLHHHKNTAVTTPLATQQPHHNFIHWPHWSHMDHSLAPSRDVPRHPWSWRHSHSVGAGAA